MRSFLLAATCLVVSACAAPELASHDGAAQGDIGPDSQCPVDGEARRDQLDASIHDYLTRHPEVLMEMSAALRQKQRAAMEEKAKQALADNHAALFDDPADPVVGNPKGDVTVIEFFDAECPYCKKLAPDLRRLMAVDPGVKLIYKEFPILGPGSMAAAKAALAARRQGKYEAFHDALMADATPEHQLAEPRILQIAKAAGLDVARLKTDMASPEIAAKIAANIDLARKIGLTGTPGLIIGGSLVPGAMPYEALKQAVAEARLQKITARQ